MKLHVQSVPMLGSSDDGAPALSVSERKVRFNCADTQTVTFDPSEHWTFAAMTSSQSTQKEI